MYYKSKQDLSPEGSDLASDVFVLCIQMKYQLEAFRQLGNAFLGIDATHNVTQYMSWTPIFLSIFPYFIWIYLMK